MPLNAKAKRKDIHYIMKKVNDFFSKRLSPVFSNSVQARKQRGCLRLINCYIGRFYGRCPNPQFLKKLSKLFCFWTDNLALAKFQSPSDTPLNHNLIKLSDYLFVSIICKAVTSLESIVPSSVISA